jgi:hypothetical protein
MYICSSEDDPESMDMELLERIILENSKKNQLKHLKIDIFFRNLLTPAISKTKWCDWIHYD